MPAGTAESDHKAALSLPPVKRQRILEQRPDPAVKSVGLLKGKHIIIDRRVASGQKAQRGDVKRIRQAAHVKNQIGVGRNPVLKSKRQNRDLHRRLLGISEQGGNPLPELRRAQIRGVQQLSLIHI